jgi:hypothetical protein
MILNMAKIDGLVFLCAGIKKILMRKSIPNYSSYYIFVVEAIYSCQANSKLLLSVYCHIERSYLKKPVNTGFFVV